MYSTMNIFLSAFRRAAFSAITRLPFGFKLAMFDAVNWRLEEITYTRLKNAGFDPKGVIDIGAHEGNWTLSTKRIFPAAEFLMIEARREMQPKLDDISARVQKVNYAIALLGDNEREQVPFNVQVSGTGSSLYPERSDTITAIKMMSMQMLDHIVPKTLPTPLFIKLDVQGAELDILRGGPETLQKADIVQLELPLLPYNAGAPSFCDYVCFMRDQGFSIYDIANFIRPYNKHLVQMDAIFVRTNSSLRPTQFTFTN
jgi:FkbM family methyltransferase